MKYIKITILLIILSVLTCDAVFAASRFEDIDNYAWASEAINELTYKGIIKGISDTEFGPSRYITRADFTVLVVRLLKLDADSINNFSDVYIGAYYAKEVGIAKALRIVSEDPNGKFRPNEPITRQDMMLTIYRSLGAAKRSVVNKGVDISKFEDWEQIDSYALTGARLLVSAEIIKGANNKLYPKEYVSRAEAAVVLHRILK